MFFYSIKFVIFLPIVFVLYWYVFSKSIKTQNSFLLLASYVFYAFADYRFLLLLAFTTTCTYYSALAISKYKEQEKSKKAKMVSALNIIANLLVLGFFKYYNFFVSSFAALLPGVSTDSLMLNIVLPLGISYYTFSALSYSIDVYSGKTKATTDFIQVAIYISFFPQLIAGPIGRSTYLLSQYNNKRVFNYEESTDGLRQILWGLFKKLVIADNCAAYANEIGNNFSNYSSIELFTALLLFAVYVYGDFSGYSDIAIGIAKLFGIKIKQNFRYPFFSTNIMDFWSRWHISLTGWFRDYVYAPLGGVWSKATIIRNIFIVFIICGLWHGASWNLFAWGLFNACLFVPAVLSFKYKKKREVNSVELLYNKAKKVIVIILTDIALLLGVIIACTSSINQAISYLMGILRFDPINSISDSNFFSITSKRLIVVVIMLIFEWLNKNEEHGLALSKIHSPIIRYCIYYFISLSIIIFGSQVHPFIYAQF